MFCKGIPYYIASKVFQEDTNSKGITVFVSLYPIFIILEVWMVLSINRKIPEYIFSSN